MAKVSATEAAKMVGKSIPTITRAIKSGKLSAEKMKPRGYQIDTAELFRVYQDEVNVSNSNSKTLDDETPKNTSVLEAKVKMLEERVEELKEQRDKWEAQAQKISGLIENQQGSRTPSPGLLERMGGLFSRRKTDAA